ARGRPRHRGGPHPGRSTAADDRLRRGHVPLPERTGRGAARPDLGAADRLRGRAGRGERRRQVDPGQARLRRLPADPGPGAGGRGRAGRTGRGGAGGLAAPGRPDHPGVRPVAAAGGRQRRARHRPPLVGPDRPDPGPDAGSGRADRDRRAGRDHRPDRPAARGLGDAGEQDHPRRHRPGRRRVAADRAGPGAARRGRRGAGPDPGRAGRGPGRGVRGPDGRQLSHPDLRRHLAGDLAPVLGGPAGAGDLRAGGRPDHRVRQPPGADGPGRPVRRDVPAPGQPVRRGGAGGRNGRGRHPMTLLRILWLWIATAFRANPRMTVLICTTTVVGSALPPLSVYGVKLIIDGATGADTLPLGVAVTVIALLVSTAANKVAGPLGDTLDDQVVRYVYDDLLRLTTGIPSLAHHENPELADRVSLIERDAHQLGGIWRMLMTIGVVSGVSTVVVLLGTVHPALNLLLLVALLPAV